jgi:hypothetical protein
MKPEQVIRNKWVVVGNRTGKIYSLTPAKRVAIIQFGPDGPFGRHLVSKIRAANAAEIREAQGTSK